MGNRLKIRVSAGFEISLTLVFTLHTYRNNRNTYIIEKKQKYAFGILAKQMTKMSFSQPLQRFVTAQKILNEKCYFW